MTETDGEMIDLRCPYCEKEMQRGTLSGSSQAPFGWKAEGKKASLFDALMGNGKLTAANYGPARFSVGAYFCADCKKLLIDTDIKHDP